MWSRLPHWRSSAATCSRRSRTSNPTSRGHVWLEGARGRAPIAQDSRPRDVAASHLELALVPDDALAIPALPDRLTGPTHASVDLGPPPMGSPNMNLGQLVRGRTDPRNPNQKELALVSGWLKL